MTKNWLNPGYNALLLGTELHNVGLSKWYPSPSIFRIKLLEHVARTFTKKSPVNCMWRAFLLSCHSLTKHYVYKVSWYIQADNYTTFTLKEISNLFFPWIIFLSVSNALFVTLSVVPDTVWDLLLSPAILQRYSTRTRNVHQQSSFFLWILLHLSLKFLRIINPLAPNDVYISRTSQLTSRRCILNTRASQMKNLNIFLNTIYCAEVVQSCITFQHDLPHAQWKSSGAYKVHKFL